MSTRPDTAPQTDFEAARYRMVATDIVARGVTDTKVIAAMAEVPREAFVPPHLANRAYADSPLPIGGGQTISQPYVVASMIQALELSGGERVLEVGTGSGYAAAVLSCMVAEVFTVERDLRLAEVARSRLVELGYDNIHVLYGDGTLGWKEHAPFDAIVVAAGAPSIPEPLRRQLKVGGRLVAPVGGQGGRQDLIREQQAQDGRFAQETLGLVRFVPLRGKEGF